MKFIVCTLVAVTLSSFLIFSSLVLTDAAALTSEDHDCHIEEGHFLCASKDECIQVSKFCDKSRDCTDGSDEFDGCETTCDGLSCEHGCAADIHNNNEATCFCRPGFKVSGIARNKCVNVNECEEKFGLCSQGCRDTVGSFICSCMEGFRLGKNNSTCIPDNPNAKLVFALRSGIRVLSLDSSKMDVVASGQGQTVGVTFDAEREEFYWTDVMDNMEAIKRGKLDGSTVEVIVNTGLVLAEGIAYDWIAENIYFTDSNLTHIGVCDRNGKFCTVVVQEALDKPREIVLHPKTGKMYWTDWGNVPSIVVAGMDGSLPFPIIDTGLNWPNGLALDQGTSRLYWVDAHSDIIETCNLDGGDRRVIKSDGIRHPFSMDIFADTLYWSDWTAHQIQSCNKFTGENHKTIHTATRDQINGVAVFHAAAQPKNRVNHCRNKPCSHICVLTPSQSFRCLCPVGMVIDGDRRTCKDDKNRERLFLAEGSQLKRFHFHSIGKDVIETRNIPGLQAIGTAIHNPLNDTYIIYDSFRRRIFTYNYTANRLEPLVTRHLDAVRGLAMDVIGHNLYWVDAGKQTVEVLSMRTGARAVIYHEFMYRPTDVVVVPDNSSIFVSTTASREGQILRMDMDGEVIDVILHINNGEPVALTYHHELGHLFWCDHVRGTIEHLSIDGQMRFLAVLTKGSPYSLASYRNRIFWTDRYSETLNSLIIGTDHEDSPILISGDEDRMNDTMHGNFYTAIGILNADLAYVKDLMDGHECSPNSGSTFKKCSHLCAPSQEELKGKCFCPNGLELAPDGLNCVPFKSCLSGQFRCNSGLCIPDETRCDSIPDCPDGDDERNCTNVTVTCRASEFRCQGDQACIPFSWKCDGEKDCMDGTDEEKCESKPCPHHSDIRCKLGRCLPASWRCDTVVDCPDNDDTDEANCDYKCSEGEFKCGAAGGHQCIPSNWVCDGEPDCPDGSDEHTKCKVECRQNEFRCMNHECIRQRYVCNGRDDCGDNSDEASCPLNGTIGFLPSFGIRGTTIPFNVTTIRPRNRDSDSICPGKFHCLSGECLDYNFVCNGSPNCFDGSDEEGNGCAHACGIANECSHKCWKTPVGSACTCHEGYKLAEDKKHCEDVDECQENRCSHFCKNLKGSFKCTCHPEYFLKSDHKTCKAKGDPPLFIYSGPSSSSSLKSRVYVTSQDMLSPATINIPSTVNGLDVDARRKEIYWSSERRGIIGRSSMDPNKGNETLFTNLALPSVLAYDWISNNIYVASRVSPGRDRQRKLVIKICSVSSDPKKRLCAVLYESSGHEVTDIVVAPADHYVFWSEISFNRYSDQMGSIRRGRVDSVENTNIASGEVINPRGLAVDHVFKTVYWIDAGKQVIEAVNFDGTKRAVIIPSGVSKRASGLAVFENWVMWSEDGKNIRCRTDMQASCMNVTMHNVSDARHLKLLQPSLQPAGKDPCAGSPCSHICTGAEANMKQNYTCYCPEGYESQDDHHKRCTLKKRKEPVIPIRTDVIRVKPGSVNDREDDIIADSNSELDAQEVLSRRLDEKESDSSGAAATVVITCLVVLVICLIIGAVIFYRRNGTHPKILVRPYVQQWVKYVNDPVQRWRGENRREPLTNQDAYSEVYEASGSDHAYENPVYENNPKQRNVRKGKEKGNVPGSRTDSGIITLVDSDGPAPYEYEDISDGQYMSYSQHDKLLDSEFT